MSLEPAVSSVSKNSSYFLSAYNVPGAVLSIYMHYLILSSQQPHEGNTKKAYFHLKI